MTEYPYRAIATLKYRPPPSQGPSISFDKGSIVTVLGSADDEGDWLEGENEQGVKGIFPATFVERVEGGEERESGETSNTADKGQEIESVDVGRATEAKDEAPAPAAIEQAAASVSAPTTSPPPPTSPPTVPESALESNEPASPKVSKPGPPPPAKKPNALAARIAAFNQSQQASNAPPAPVPRPKPTSKWTVGSSSSSSASSPPPAQTGATSLSATETPSSPPPSAPSPALAQDETDTAGKPKEFSAEDAKESIGRGGGSLRDRIKALQGLQIDQPAPPGRPPKPWKKKVVEDEEASAASEQPEGEVEGKSEQESVVKDQEPKHDVEQTVEEERVPDVPSFEPAEPASKETETSAGATVDDEAVKESAKSTETEEPETPSPPPSTDAAKPTSIDLLSVAADTNPVVMTPGSASLEVPTSPSPFIPSTDKPPVSPQNEQESVPGEDDSEAAKKSAIAARMAGLGGQKIGAVPIAALPKKAAGPRRNPRGGAAKAPTSAPPVDGGGAQEAKTNETEPVEIEQTGVGAKNESVEQVAGDDSPTEHSGSKEAETEVIKPQTEEDSEKKQASDVLASMGGASSLLASEDEDDGQKPRTTFDEDEDDFDTPAPPPPSRPVAAPPAPPRAESTFEDPELGSGEHQVDEEEFAQREATVQDEPTIDEQAIDTLPTPETAEPVVDDATAEQDAHESEPPLPLNRPPVPPAFVRQVSAEPPKMEIDSHRFTAEVDNPDAASSSSGPPPPARPTKAPPLASGNETIADEPRPTAQGPDDISPTPPDSQSRSPVVIPADVAGFKLPKEGETQKPPVPRHPAHSDQEKVTTEAEDRIMNETEVVTPPQEAFDESTAAPELTAPSVLDLAEVRDSHPEATDLSQQALPSPGRKEGELSPPPVPSPRQTSRAQSETEADGEEEGADDEDEDEEEDPEVARRRAIAARMAKLGGMSMRMGPMIPPMGGMPPTTKKKAKKPKAEEEQQPREDLEAKDLNEQVVESQSSGTVTPDHPARRYGGIPSGGFALPGIAALRPVHSEAALEEPETSETLPDEPVQGNREEEPVIQANEEEQEQASAPPPLPAGRPLSMPPRRSVPIPEPEPENEAVGATEEDDQYEADAAEPTRELVEEPEHEEEAAPPPPPARPVGGHRDSLPPMSAVPSSPPPPTRPIPTPSKRESTLSLGRSTTRSSHRSSTIPTNAASIGFASPKQSLDLAFDQERIQGGGTAQGQFIAKDLDLDTQTGSAWWRTPNGLPRSLQRRSDVVLEFLADAPGNKELEVIYQDYSRTLVSIAFDPEDSTEASTSISQNHFPPPGKPSLDVLLQYSASLGAQIFAAAHQKASDKSARGLNDKQLVDFCFSRATEPVPPIGTTFGAKVYEVSLSSEGKKGPAFAMDDEPRSGDVVVFNEVKLKQTLGSKTIGSHVAIVSGFDEKKVKLRVLEVDKNGSSVDEGSYKLDDLKQGTITIYRVLGKDFL